MAFFEEIKAKLGLDISSFESGMARATQAAKGSMSKIGGNIANLGKASTALATALGINVNAIAEKLARFWTGVSKETEAALEEQVRMSEDAARKQEDALAKLRDKHKSLSEQVAKIDHENYLNRISLQRREHEQLIEVLNLRAKIAETNDGSVKNLELRVELDKKVNDLAETRKMMVEAEAKKQAELVAMKEKQAQIDAENQEIINNLNQREFEAEKQLMDMRAEARFEAMSDEEKLQALKQEGIAALKLAQETGLKQDELAVEIIRKKYNEILAKITASKKELTSLSEVDSGMAKGDTGWTTRNGRQVGERQIGADGKVRLRGAVLSSEDIARADQTKEDVLKTELVQANKYLERLVKEFEPTSTQ